METYLLTWNPEQKSGFDIATCAKQTAAGKTVDGDWSCGNTRKIKKGYSVFLVRVAVEPKGIVGFGRVTRPPYFSDHWGDEKSNKDKEALYIVINWKWMIDAQIDLPLPLSKLPTAKSGKKRWTLRSWTPRRSGIEIPSQLLKRLEMLWDIHIKKSLPGVDFVDDEASAFEGQARLAFVRHRRREKKLRAAKLVQARHRNKGRLFCDVPGCGFDFQAVYGELGRDYAQVHHLKPLADATEPTQTKLDGLAVVCANCHVIIHRGGECRPLDKLIA